MIEYNKNIKKFLQSFYDYTFRQIELSIREIGYGDATINKKMKISQNIKISVISITYQKSWENLFVYQLITQISELLDCRML